MPEKILSGLEHARTILNQLTTKISNYKKNNPTIPPPGLAIIQVGSHPASNIYVNKKTKTAQETGITIQKNKLDNNINQSDLIQLIINLNLNPNIHGILVQLPLPAHIDSNQILETIDPNKDVDGFHAINLGKLMQNKPGFIPCTPKGIFYLLKTLPINLPGLHATILGRSLIVGKPLGLLLLNNDLTATYCHSQTQNLSDITRQSDIIVTAIGKPKFLTQEFVKPGAIVIDVGINRLPTGELVGDVDFDSVHKTAGWITPVPGGVGPMTVAMLMQNTYDSWENSIKKLKKP